MQNSRPGPPPGAAAQLISPRTTAAQMSEHTLDQDTERDTGYILLNRSKLIRIADSARVDF